MWQSISQSQGKDTKPAGVIAFLSCEPQSHVTEVAGHLGMFVANTTKKRVLLVDGDQRGSRLSMKYSVNKDYGLTNALLQGSDWAELVQPTANRNIFVLPAGTSSPPLGGFDQSVVQKIVDEWKSTFDYVFVDNGQAYSLSANPVHEACDATYVVLRLGETNRNEADQVIQQLLDNENNLTGCVVTNMP